MIKNIQINSFFLFYLSYSCTTFKQKNTLIGKVKAIKMYEKKTNNEPQQFASSALTLTSTNSSLPKYINN